MFLEAIRDLKMSFLIKLHDSDTANNLFVELQNDHGTHLPLYLTQLRRLVENVRFIF
jgi:hypothetical protein